MTDNNIIELTPFRADLTRALARRGERLLAATDLADEVASLEPLEAYYIVREIGLDQALPILLQLSQEQLEACIDLDCWHRYDFAVDSLDEWLAAFALDGIKHALREEADKDQPSFYLIGSCIANMRVIADCISENVHGIETMSGFAAD